MLIKVDITGRTADCASITRSCPKLSRIDARDRSGSGKESLDIFITCLSNEKLITLPNGIMFLTRVCCLRSVLRSRNLLVPPSGASAASKSRVISSVVRFPPLGQQPFPPAVGQRADEGFQIADESIQKYLENIRLEYYALKVSDQLDKKDIKRMALLSHVVEMYEQRRIIMDNLNSLQEMSAEKDEDMLQLMREEKEVGIGNINHHPGRKLHEGFPKSTKSLHVLFIINL